MSGPTTPRPPSDILWLRRIIFWAQPLIALIYILMSVWGTSPARPQGLWLVLLVMPAMAVLPGMLAQRYSAFVWAALTDLLYLLVASTDAWSLPADRAFNLMIVVLAITGFCAAWAQGILLRQRSRRGNRKLTEARDKLDPIDSKHK